MKKPKTVTRGWLTRWANKLAIKADVQDPYWFIHNAGGECGTFCFECGEKRRHELIAKHCTNAETLSLLTHLDGGRALECDGCEHCDTCGQLLEYSLTNYGAESEWEHFAEHGISINCPDDAYHIQAILDHGLKLASISKLKLRGRASK